MREPLWPSGRVLARPVSRRTSVRFRLKSSVSFLFKGCELWILARDFATHSEWNIKVALIAVSLSAEIILVVTVKR